MSVAFAESKTKENLMRAFAGESQARNRYTFAAGQAEKENLAAVAEVEKLIAGNGRALLRESGTEPVIRVMIESETDALCRAYADKIADVIKAKGHCVE